MPVLRYAIDCIPRRKVIQISRIAIGKLSRELRSTKWAPPTGCTSPMAFISVWAVARPTPKSPSISTRPPCFGTCVSDALPDGGQITHRKPQLSDTFRIPGFCATWARTFARYPPENTAQEGWSASAAHTRNRRRVLHLYLGACWPVISAVLRLPGFTMNLPAKLPPGGVPGAN